MFKTTTIQKSTVVSVKTEINFNPDRLAYISLYFQRWVFAKKRSRNVSY